MTKSMTCNVPERTGYQVIYGVWEIADTTNSFYQAIDVDFGNGGNVTPDDTPAVISQWSKTLSGQIAGNNLNMGDKVIARFFDANGEVAALRTEMTIGSSEQGDANQWSYDLAQKINTATAMSASGERMKRVKLVRFTAPTAYSSKTAARCSPLPSRMKSKRRR